MPKLERMGILITLFQQLTSPSLKEILCLFSRMLYDYVPQCYRNVPVTADMSMEKIRYISPAIHFSKQDLELMWKNWKQVDRMDTEDGNMVEQLEELMRSLTLVQDLEDTGGAWRMWRSNRLSLPGVISGQSIGSLGGQETALPGQEENPEMKSQGGEDENPLSELKLISTLSK